MQQGLQPALDCLSIMTVSLPCLLENSSSSARDEWTLEQLGMAVGDHHTLALLTSVVHHAYGLYAMPDASGGTSVLSHIMIVVLPKAISEITRRVRHNCLLHPIARA